MAFVNTPITRRTHHATMSRMVVCLLAASVLIEWASAVCNEMEASASLDSGDCNCTDSSLLYDYRENVCKDEKVLYLYDGYGPFGNESGCRNGFTINVTTGQCDDVDECAADPGPCSSTTVCRNTVGQYHCGCRDQFGYSGGTCIDFDESVNPLWNDCPQVVYNRAPGYACYCYNTNMFNDTQGDGKSCELYPGYTDCTKDTDTGVMCVEESASSNKYYFALPGYEFNASNESEAVDECLDTQVGLCWGNAECEDQLDGYQCKCLPGYSDEVFTGDIKECLPVKCSRGDGLDCVDACDTTECLEDEYCVLQNNLPTCTRQLADAVFYRSLTENVFSVPIVIWNSDESPGQVTQSLEMVFGAGTVQLLPQNTTRPLEFTLHVLLNMTQHDVEERLDTHCVSLEQLAGYCELPGGVIIQQVLIDFALVEVVCAADQCPQDTHDCDVGTRKCMCKDNGTQTYFDDILEICDTAALEQQLKDAEESVIDAEDAVKVTAAVLGTLLGFSLVVIVGLVFFKKGRFFSS